ncbi:hypothetical protein H8959_017609, partial [Pygathrix nigripes]
MWLRPTVSVNLLVRVLPALSLPCSPTPCISFLYRFLLGTVLCFVVLEDRRAEAANTTLTELKISANCFNIPQFIFMTTLQGNGVTMGFT